MTLYPGPREALPARRPHDYYPTEPVLIRAALAGYGPKRPPWSVLDPGAGDGRWGQAAKRIYPGTLLHGVELRWEPRPAGFDGWWPGVDFRRFAPSGHPCRRYSLRSPGQCPERTYDFICGNPPYGPVVDDTPMAEHFVRHAWRLLAGGGRILFLLRLAFMASVDRYAGLWSELPPTVVAVCSTRPSFGVNKHGRKGTQNIEYALFVWDKQPDGDPAGEPRQWPVELLPPYERE